MTSYFREPASFPMVLDLPEEKELDEVRELLSDEALPFMSDGATGDALYVLVQEYNSRPIEGAEFEAHRLYADIHYVRDGSERMAYSHIGRLEVTAPYDEGNDSEMLRGEGDSITLFAGMFAIAFPEDAHMPSLAVGEPAHTRKVVVKIRL